MDIVLNFLGALGLFIFGIYVLSAGLRKAAGDKMKRILEKLSKKRWQGVLFGACVTAVIQSSTATTVTAIGFVNAGIMGLSQVAGVIMGANLGTVTTSWFIAVTEWAEFLRPASIGAICAASGAVMLLFSKKKKYKNIGEIIIGFGVLFIGLTLMTDAVRPLRELEGFRRLFAELGANPVLGILAGIIVTGLIQSSTASIGILQGMAVAGLIMPWNAAVYIIMGLNIGTTITAVISSLGASKNARAAAYIHLVYNVMSVAVFIVPTVIYFTFINNTLANSAISSTAISGVHTVFNIASLIVLYPFANFLVFVALKMTGKDKNGSNGSDAVHLDDRVLKTPVFALEMSEKEIDRLANMTLDNLNLAIECFFDKAKDTEPVRVQEDNIDKLEAAIAAYLVKVSSENLSKTEIDTVASLFHVLTDIERIADHAENIAELADNMRAADPPDFDAAVADLQKIRDVTLACYIDAITALNKKDKELARAAVREEAAVDELERAYRSAHINKLSSGEHSLRSGVIFLDMLNNLERITDHSRNIAEVVLKQ
jgi:phosphate:Na+ symporter